MPSTPTTKMAIPLPAGGDDVAVPADLRALAERIDEVAAWQDQGAFSSRPTVSLERKGMRYYATDHKLEYLCTGTEWRLISKWSLRSVGSAAPQGAINESWPVYDPEYNTPRPSLTVPFSGTFDVVVALRVRQFTSGVGSAAPAVVALTAGASGPVAGIYVPSIDGETPSLGAASKAPVALTAGATLNASLSVVRAAGALPVAINVVSASVELVPVQAY
jgi:hypothetical protein